MYNNNLGYVSINSARSALSTIFGRIDGHSIGSHPLVVRLCKGVGRLKPPRVKYQVTWDATNVLDMFNEWQINALLSIRELSMKLVALLALCTAQRTQTIHSLLLSNVKFDNNGVTIKVDTRLKTSKPGEGLLLQFCKFDNPKLCIVECLSSYIDRTANARKSDKLLISSKSPFHAVSIQTISNWLKAVLAKAGIDVNTFSSHSYRHSSSSKALSLGVTSDVIFKSAGWSDKSKVFAKFYNRPIVNNSSYATTMLSSATNV
jgi:integrase